MIMGYWVRKRQDYNWYYADYIWEVAPRMEMQMLYDPGYLPLYSAYMGGLAISRGFAAPDYVVETAYTWKGFSLGYPENPTPGTLVPGSHTELFNEYQEDPDWAPEWNFAMFFVSYYEQYYTEWVENPGSPVFIPTVIFSPWNPNIALEVAGHNEFSLHDVHIGSRNDEKFS